VIQAWWFPPGRGPAEPLDIGQAGTRRDGVVLVDVASPTRADLELVAEQFHLDPLLFAAIGRRPARSRVVPWGEHRQAVLSACRITPRGVSVKAVELVFSTWFVVILRWDGDGDSPEPYPLDDVQRGFAASRRAGGPYGVGGLLWALFDQLAEDAFDVVEALDDRLDRAEEVVFDADEGDTVPRDLFELRRSLTAVRRASAPQRDIVAALLRSERELVGEGAHEGFERVHDHLLRIAELAESQRDVLTGLLDAHLAMAANRTNEVMKRTSSWGAILVVATLVVGYYGMNFDLPELSWRFGWLWAFGLMVALTGALYLAFKKRGWL
jgi:magnesium transporter